MRNRTITDITEAGRAALVEESIRRAYARWYAAEQVYASRDDVIRTQLPVDQAFVWTAGYAAAGDGGAALYKRVATEPPHAGKIRSSDGAWWEIVGPMIPAAALGAFPGTGRDTAMTISAALAIPQVSIVMLDRGVYEVDEMVVVPSHKTLAGTSPLATIVRARPTFRRVLDPHPTNGVIGTAIGAVEPCIRDLTADGNRVGFGKGLDARVHGIFFREAKRFLEERTITINCTGYGHYARGRQDPLIHASGTTRTCWSFNCEIGFEQMTCDGILIDDCHARNGDGDISNLSFFHPLTRSKNIRYRTCTAVGDGIGFEITHDVGDITGISLEACLAETSTVAVVIDGSPKHFASNVRITDCDLKASSQAALVIARGEVVVIGSRLSCGNGPGIVVGADARLRGMQSDVRSTTDGSGGSLAVAVFVQDRSATLRWIGGTLEARGPIGSVPVNETDAALVIDASVEQIPKPNGALPTIRSELYGNSIIEADGPNSFATIRVPAVLDFNKAYFFFAVRSADGDKYVASDFRSSYSFVDEYTVRVRIAGANLAGSTLTWRFAEFT